MKGKHKAKNNNKKFIFLAIVLIAILVFVFNRNQNTIEISQSINNTDGEKVSLNGLSEEVLKGNPNATVTIIEWSDFECPYCQKFYTDTLGQIKEEYIDTGKVKMVFKDFPLSFHKQAQKASEAAECAGDQGRYWDMHDTLFTYGVEGGVSQFKKYAASLGLNTEEFNQCLDSGKYFNEIQNDMQEGKQAGVSGTPAFLINGKLIVGAQPFVVFQQIIEEELAK